MVILNLGQSPFYQRHSKKGHQQSSHSRPIFFNWCSSLVGLSPLVHHHGDKLLLHKPHRRRIQRLSIALHLLNWSSDVEQFFISSFASVCLSFREREAISDKASCDHVDFSLKGAVSVLTSQRVLGSVLSHNLYSHRALTPLGPPFLLLPSFLLLSWKGVVSYNQMYQFPTLLHLLDTLLDVFVHNTPMFSRCGCQSPKFVHHPQFRHSCWLILSCGLVPLRMHIPSCRVGSFLDLIPFPNFFPSLNFFDRSSI